MKGAEDGSEGLRGVRLAYLDLRIGLAVLRKFSSLQHLQFSLTTIPKILQDPTKILFDKLDLQEGDFASLSKKRPTRRQTEKARRSRRYADPRGGKARS